VSKNYIILHRKKKNTFMSALTGNIEGKLDSKGRAFLPATFRHQLGEENVFYLRKDLFENCLVLYPSQTWENMVAELRQRLSPWVRQEDQIFRQFVAEADRIELEENGRMLIPKRYLTAIDIRTEIRFIGRDTVIEIWPLGKVEETFVDANLFASKMEQLMKNARKNIEK
jgi:MraZ protein